MILQIITPTTTVGLTLTEMVIIIATILGYSIALLRQWFWVKMKIKEQDTRIANIEIIVTKNEDNMERIIDKLGETLEKTREELLYNQKEVMTELKILSQQLDKHISFEEGRKSKI